MYKILLIIMIKLKFIIKTLSYYLTIQYNSDTIRMFGILTIKEDI